MIRLLLWGLLVYCGFRIVSSLKRTAKHPDDTRRERGPTSATHRDPVCGIYVTEDDAVVDTYRGKIHYFCSPACRDRFREHPEHT
ncbi:YHS domain-containing protein [Pelobacter propionicus]|uniref:TRASH domain protein n=1 Tax=Pelobacter propionicus (strain DSM 2379 / NBRC 103807 / OttBd1) TaxID=338966 RepID=A1AKQ9_PELPD|nr:YHS domain-containing protein [Pelobacter propionicus]ABK97929.1 TRASH domain protein [Pelobacter propionicus DSM 2379]